MGRLLGGYPTSDEEDEAALQENEGGGPGAPPRTARPVLWGSERAAVRVRLREKQLLLHALNLLGRRVARLKADLGAGKGAGAVSPPDGFSASKQRRGGSGEL